MIKQSRMRRRSRARRRVMRGFIDRRDIFSLPETSRRRVLAVSYRADRPFPVAAAAAREHPVHTRCYSRDNGVCGESARRPDVHPASRRASPSGAPSRLRARPSLTSKCTRVSSCRPAAGALRQIMIAPIFFDSRLYTRTSFVTSRRAKTRRIRHSSRKKSGLSVSLSFFLFVTDNCYRKLFCIVMIYDL